MDCPTLSALSPPRKTWADRLQAFFEIVLVSGLISSFLAALPFSAFHWRGWALSLGDARVVSLFLFVESGITFALLALVLKSHREDLETLGLDWERWKAHAAAGLLLVPLLFLINALVAFLFRVYWPAHFVERNPLTEIIRTPRQLGLFIVAALFAGGIKEELQRAFILNRFRRFLGGSGTGLVLWSLFFGLGHYVQGLQGITIACLYGFLFGVIYLASGSLIAPMVAHGAYDTVALLAYWFSTGRFR